MPVDQGARPPPEPIELALVQTILLGQPISAFAIDTVTLTQPSCYLHVWVGSGSQPTGCADT